MRKNNYTIEAWIMKTTITLTPTQIQTNYSCKIYPTEIKWIWEKTSGVIYGNYNDNYIGGIIRNTTKTATAGSITLGNCVGFLELNYNGKIVKIPYYT